tara:strand:+ start:1136 stop:1597 length:462 start_codon:yes stop_codon:yes gene_type:complete
MEGISIIKHGKGSIGLRYFGLGPYMVPSRSLKKLRNLLNKETFWASNRNYKYLKIMLANSTEVISIWSKGEMIGFGRATSDKIYRAVLWDVVVATKFQGNGIGRIIVEELLKQSSLKNVEKIYLMTTNCLKFYENLNFRKVQTQSLLLHMDNN